jgi:hypothetical protein
VYNVLPQDYMRLKLKETPPPRLSSSYYHISCMDNDYLTPPHITIFTPFIKSEHISTICRHMFTSMVCGVIKSLPFLHGAYFSTVRVAPLFLI